MHDNNNNNNNNNKVKKKPQSTMSHTHHAKKTLTTMFKMEVVKAKGRQGNLAYKVLPMAGSSFSMGPSSPLSLR